jgi:Sulfotransferase family
MDHQEIGNVTRPFRIAASAHELMARAREITGIDILDTSIDEGLTRLLHSFNTESQLNQRGAIYLEQHLLRVLCNRLRMLRDFKAHPKIAEQQIVAPLFIIGGPRTGSTKLHKMLAASGDFLYLPFWQAHCLSLRSGDRGEDPAARIQDANQYVRWMDQHAPRAQLNHGYSTFEPEEEMLICEHSLCTVFPALFGEIPSYMAWWATHDFREYIKFLKQGLQYLQWQFHDGDPRPWLLKCPVYFGVEHILAEGLPGARFVSTHRHPLSSVPSTINLVNGYREACSDTDWRRTLGVNYCEGLAMGTEQTIAVRDSHPQLNTLDISYAALTRSAEQVTENIYAHIGMELSGSARQNMRDWDKAHPAPKPGPEQYSLADFSLTDQEINHRFSRYIERFKRYF